MTLENVIPASTLTPIRDALAEFQRHLAEHVPAPELALLTDLRWSDQEYYDYCRATRVYFNWGVYVHLAEDGRVLYAGVAVSQSNKGPMHECWNVQQRINDDSNKPLDGRRWIVAAVLPVSSKWGFLLFALEAFLIARFQPKFNSNMKHLILGNSN
jgi:hypothetical protein